MLRIWQRAVGLGLLIMSLAGCYQEAQEAVVPTLPAVVAKVNGETISRSEFERAVTRQQAVLDVEDSVLRIQVLETLIEQRLINQAAAGMGITVTDEEVQAEIARLQTALGGESGWQDYLNANNYTAEEMMAAQRDVLLTQRFQEVLFAGLNGSVKQVHARHIVVPTETAANDILQRLQSGQDFATLAAEFSIDLTTKDLGGDLGWFMVDELIDRRLAEVAFNLQPGQVAGPIGSLSGYHIIQVLEFAERPIEPERTLLIQRNMYDRWLSEQLTQAQIERYQ